MTEYSDDPGTGYFEELATDVGQQLEDWTLEEIPGEWDNRVLEGELVDHATDVGSAVDDLVASETYGEAGAAVGSMVDEYVDYMAGAMNPASYLVPDEYETDTNLFETAGEAAGEAVDWAADAAGDVSDWITGEDG